MRISDWSSDVCSSDLDIDADPRLTRLAPDWRRDNEAHRAEIGVIARADPGTEAQILERRRRRAIDLPRIDETDDAEIAEAIARLERQLVHAAAADRIVVRVLRPQLLIAEAAHRTAAAGIETPRGREAIASGHQNRAETPPPCEQIGRAH